ncbi:hypothetical protein K501DRAFT_282674 [Backusella circina FSU 941]|nr:hypothetical protein K501DRAFT_282674 [Backusella circina FSU 941]
MVNINDRKSIQYLLQTNTKLYYTSQQDYFYSDLCKQSGIHYHHPDMTWKQLFFSGELKQMCPHLYPHRLYADLDRKRDLLWRRMNQEFQKEDNCPNYIMCLEERCHYFDHSDTHPEHYLSSHHSIVLKISPLHTLELWCHSCRKTIGFDGFATTTNHGIKAERHIMHTITKALAQPKEQDAINGFIISSRREIEANIFRIQTRQFKSHLVDKTWHASWLDFLSGKTNTIPGPMTSQNLLRSDGSLNPSLSLGKDFELVGSLVRWYIERVYGVLDVIISGDDLENEPEYCKLVHTIRIRHQMIQAGNFQTMPTLA